jgi:ElaB/YqjD/DUF883 family membrane-anchored ribosome-binding protein
MNKNGTTSIENGAAAGTSAFEDRIDSIKESVKGFVHTGQEKAGELKDRAGEIKTKVIEVKDQAMTKGTAVADQAANFIRANPMKAVGIAFGLGYIGMRLFRR